MATLTPQREQRALMVRRLIRSNDWREWNVNDVAKAFAVNVKELSADLELTNPISWTARGPEFLLKRLFAFWDARQRWPISKDWTNENGLPSRGTLNGIFNKGYTSAQEVASRGRYGNWYRPSPPSSFRPGWTEAQRLIGADKKTTPVQILALPNVTIRREAMEKIGIKKMIKAGGGKKIKADKFGTLWELPAEGENLMYLEVVNSTPEPDGKFAHYFLRVPPTMTVPRQAVAWTFEVEDGWEEFEVRVAT